MVDDEVMALTRGFGGRVGIAAENLATGDRVSLHADEVFPTASAIKVFVLGALFEGAAAGRIALDERCSLSHAARTLGSGVLVHLSPGLEPTWSDLATLMMMVSDNLATNLLVDRIGIDAINAHIVAAGLERTALNGRIDFSRLAADKTALGVATPADFVRYFAGLRRGELLDAAHAERMLDVLRIQKYIEPLRRMLPADPYAREFGDPDPVWVASKTGSLSGLRCEAGLVHTPRAEWAIAVMTRDVADTRVTSDNDAVRLIADLSRAVYDAWG
jgi:beta-lactamase class A